MPVMPFQNDQNIEKELKNIYNKLIDIENILKQQNIKDQNNTKGLYML